MNMNAKHTQTCGYNESGSKRQCHRTKCLHKRKWERSHTSKLTAQIKALEPKEEITPKRHRWQEVVELRAKINRTEKNKTIQRINKTKIWVFEKISKIDKPLSKSLKSQREDPN